MKARISAQAQMVLDVLAARRCHLTADEILENLDGIGTATVYRALDHLTEMGLIRRLSLGKKSAVYEYIRTNHMHFVCEQCGNVYDIEADFTGMAAEALTKSFWRSMAALRQRRWWKAHFRTLRCWKSSAFMTFACR